MKICIVVGTRPEIIKMSSFIRLCEEKAPDYFIIHSNQHYSENMDKVFFEELKLPMPKYNLNIGSSSHANQTGNILIKIEEILLKEKPTIVLAQGDTNTVLAAALATSKLNINFGHIEAGLRSYNNFMPEEKNRIVADHISDYLFAPTELQRNILINEGIDKSKIYVTGNTIVDAVLQNSDMLNSSILENLGFKPKNYVLVTAHRTTTVDHKTQLKKLAASLTMIADSYPIVYPLHPRTKKMLERFKILLDERIKIIEPVGYLEFLMLEKNAKIIFTDSGGVQEEACILKVPCVTIRDDTERPETIEVGSNVLAGVDKSRILDAIKLMLAKDTSWKNPFGDGTTSEKIYRIISS